MTGILSLYKNWRYLFEVTFQKPKYTSTSRKHTPNLVMRFLWNSAYVFVFIGNGIEHLHDEYSIAFFLSSSLVWVWTKKIFSWSVQLLFSIKWKEREKKMCVCDSYRSLYGWMKAKWNCILKFTPMEQLLEGLCLNLIRMLLVPRVHLKRNIISHHWRSHTILPWWSFQIFK